MSSVEKEIRVKATEEQIEHIREVSEPFSKRTRMVDITCGKYGFESLATVGYICRIRALDHNYKLEIKNYSNSEKCMEKSIPLESIRDGLEFLELVGMTPYLVLDRYREIRKYNDLMIFIDEFKNDVGNFVEIEYQNSTRKEAIDFIRKMKMSEELQDKYGDIIKERLQKDKEFEEKFTESLNDYKKKTK